PAAYERRSIDHFAGRGKERLDLSAFSESPMTVEPRPISEWRGVDEATFHGEVVPRYRPAVLRGVVADWPAVRQAMESSEAIDRYLRGFSKGGPVDAIIMPPHVH